MQQTPGRLGIGALGGAAGLLVMEGLRQVTKPMVERAPKPSDDGSPEDRSISPLGVQHEQDESATDAVGRLAHVRMTGRSPSAGTKRKLSWAVHLGYGLVVAAGYGLLRAGRVRHSWREGAAFGAALWLMGDQLAVPLLGLSDKPSAYPAARHLQSLATHIGFGIATATVVGAFSR
jgi:uncharacterized membrane protein YagU involved in acid resistance